MVGRALLRRACLVFLFAGRGAGQPSEGVRALRAASIFEGFMAALGLRIVPRALPRAIGPQHSVCGLGFDKIYVEMEDALGKLHSLLSEAHHSVPDDQERALTSLQQLGRSIHGFAQACHRCSVVHAPRLSVLARMALAADESSVRVVRGGDNVAAFLSISLDGTERRSEFEKAAKAWKTGRYHLAGLSLVMALSNPEHNKEDAMMGSRRLAAFDSTGRMRQERDFEEHRRAHHSRHARELLETSRALEQAEPPNLEENLSTDYTDVCCCCWADEMQTELSLR